MPVARVFMIVSFFKSPKFRFYLDISLPGTLHENNTYKAIRIAGPTYNLYYSVWCNNEHELYDMTKDPGQMNNLLSPTAEPAFLVAGYPLEKVASRLDSLLFVLKSCKGRVCREPWKNLHPDGNVSNLEEALSSKFDDFYEVQQNRVKFDYCWNGYVPEAEGPMWEKHGFFLRDGLPWHTWV